MFEHETESILSSIRTRVLPPGTSGLMMKDLLASDVPAAVKAFFRVDIETMLQNEQLLGTRNSRFPLDHPDVRNLQQQINSILVLHYPFTAGEFSDRLAGAVHMIVNYLVRPQWTLTGVIYERDDSLSPAGLTASLRYFGAYEYLKEILIRYLRDKQPAAVSRQEFATLTWKADSQYISRRTGGELARIISPLYEFFNYPTPGGFKSLPVQGIAKFFEDKGLTVVVSHLEGELAQGRTSIDYSRLTELLETVYRTSGPFLCQPVDHPAPRTMTAPAAPPIPPEPREVRPASAGIHAEETTLTAASGRPIAVTDHERRRFVKKIFNQDEAAFSRAMTSLSQAPSWKQASRLLDEIFISTDTDPYASEAERFVDLVFQHFHPDA